MDENINLSLQQLKNNWYWYLSLGIILTILGTLAVIYSVASTIFSVIYLGILLVIFGIIELFHSFKLRKWSTVFLHFLLGILMVVSGIFILHNPFINALTLTLFFAGLFIISGILRISISIFGKEVPHKGLLFFNGIASLILGFLLWYQWPLSGLWAIGTLVGIDAIFTGWTWIFLSLKAKKLRQIY